MIQVKHGLECADGGWTEMKASFANSLHSSDHERIASYIHSWTWHARRHGSDLFATMGTELRGATQTYGWFAHVMLKRLIPVNDL